MPEFVTRVRYSDVREITVEADTYEDAVAKYEAGEFADEHTVDFYACEVVSPLRRDSSVSGEG